MSELGGPAPMAAGRDVLRRRGGLVAAILSAAVGMLVFSVTLGGTYFFDDVYHLWMDERIVSPGNWWQYLTQGYNDSIDNLYRPITSLSFAAQAWLHGRDEGDAWLYHAINLLLYGIVGAQVALLGARLWETGTDLLPAENLKVHHMPEAPGTLGRAGAVGLACGVLFAVHPVHTEAVASIVGRADLLCAIGFLGGLLVVLRPLTGRRVFAFVTLMFLSIGAKEQGLVLPAVVAVWYWARKRAGLPLETRGHGKPLLAATALTLSAYLLLREQVLELRFAWPVHLLDPTIQTMRDTTGLDRWLMPIALAGRYLHLLVWPGTLSLDYGASVIVPPQRMDDPYLWLGILALVLWSAAVGHAIWRRWPAGLTVMAGFTFSYALVSNIPRLIGTVFGERLIFLPSAFVILYVVLLAVRQTVYRPRLHRALAALALGLTLIGAFRSMSYASWWSDRVTLYEQQTRVQPRSVRVWLLLAEELRQIADRQRKGGDEAAAAKTLARAEDAAERATQIEPDYWDHWAVWARIARDQGRLEQAYNLAERGVQAPMLSNPAALIALRDEIGWEIMQRRAATQPTDAAP